MKNKKIYVSRLRNPDVQEGNVYEIKIRGLLDEHSKQWFEGMDMKKMMEGKTDTVVTRLTGLIVDQLAIHGLLVKIIV